MKKKKYNVLCLDMVIIMSRPIHNQYIAHHDTMLL